MNTSILKKDFQECIGNTPLIKLKIASNYLVVIFMVNVSFESGWISQR